MSARSQRSHCRDEAAGIDYRRYAVQRGKTNYLVEGLAGYDPALRLALASVVTDQAAAGRGAGGDDRGQRSGRLRPDPGRLARPVRVPAPKPMSATMPAVSPNRRNSSKTWPTAKAMSRHRSPKRLPTRACSSPTSAISPPPTGCWPAPSAPAHGRRRHAAADPQLSRDQPAQPAPSGGGARRSSSVSGRSTSSTDADADRCAAA